METIEIFDLNAEQIRKVGIANGYSDAEIMELLCEFIPDMIKYYNLKEKGDGRFYH